MSLQSLLQKLIPSFKEIISEDLYTIVANNLILEEIRSSNIPDKYLDTTDFDFKSQTGRIYSAGHVNHHGYAYVSLRALKPADKQDIIVVANLIANESNGNIDGIFDLTGDYRDAFGAVINLKERITQAKVADDLEKYSKHFSDVKFGFLFFRLVPQSVADSLNLPKEKLRIVPYRSQIH